MSKEAWKAAKANFEAVGEKFEGLCNKAMDDAGAERVAELRDDFGAAYVAREVYTAMNAERAKQAARRDDDPEWIEAATRMDEAGEPLFHCEGCMEPIFEGEAYHAGEDVGLCANCAPSYADMIASHENFRGENDEPMTVEEAKAVADAHVAAGGSIDDKMVTP